MDARHVLGPFFFFFGKSNFKTIACYPVLRTIFVVQRLWVFLDITTMVIALDFWALIEFATYLLVSVVAHLLVHDMFVGFVYTLYLAKIFSFAFLLHQWFCFSLLSCFPVTRTPLRGLV